MTEQPRVKTRARQDSARVASQATAWMIPQGAAQVTASALIHGKA